MSRLTSSFVFVVFTLLASHVAAQNYTAEQIAAMDAYRRGARLFKQAQADDAIAAFSEAIRYSPRYAEAYYQRGRVYLIDKEQYNRAAVDFQKSIQLKPQFAGAYNGRGLCHYQNARFDKAVEDFTAAIERDPNFVKPFANRAMVYARQGEFNRALADYARAIELEPSIALLYALRAEAYLGLGEPEKAIADCNATLGLIGSDDKAGRAGSVNVWIVYLVRAKAHTDRNDFAAAMDNFDTARRLAGPPPARFYLYRGEALAKQGNQQAAMADYDAGLQAGREFQNQPNISTQNLAFNQSMMADIHRSRGAIYAKSGQHAKAEAEFARADLLAPKPTVASAHEPRTVPSEQPAGTTDGELLPWRDFQFVEAGFKAKFPAEVDVFPMSTATGTKRWVFLAVHKGRGFGLECIPAQFDIETRGEEQIRQDLIDMTVAAAKNDGGEIESATELTVGGYPARKTRHHSTKMKATIYKQSVVTDTFLYELQVQVLDTDQLSRANVDRFFASFVLLQPKTARVQEAYPPQAASPSDDLTDREEIYGTVAFVAGDTVVIHSTSLIRPTVGDKVQITADLPGTDNSEVARGMVSDVNPDAIFAKIEQATHKIEIGQRVRIESTRMIDVDKLRAAEAIIEEMRREEALDALQPESAASDDVQKIQGEWQSVGFRYDGRENVLKHRITFEENKIIHEVHSSAQLLRGEIFYFDLTPQATPKRIDYRSRDGEIVKHGIYRLEGDSLQLCAVAATRPRPEKFEANKGDGCEFIDLRRVPAVESSTANTGSFPFVGLLEGIVLPNENRERGVPISHGISVEFVFYRGPAAKAGIRAGDIITKVNGKNVTHPMVWVEQLDACSIGDNMEVEVARHEGRVLLTVVLEDWPDDEVLLGELQAAAEAGDALAQLHLGTGHSTGYVVPADAQKAVYWLHKAAESGDLRAYLELGHTYEVGEGVRRDYSEALRYYQHAAAKELPGAQVALGSLYYHGNGVEQDFAEAYKWFARAAAQQSPEGKHNMAICLLYGDGVAKDESRAKTLLRENARIDFELSIAKLRELGE